MQIIGVWFVDKPDISLVSIPTPVMPLAFRPAIQDWFITLIVSSISVGHLASNSFPHTCVVVDGIDRGNLLVIPAAVLDQLSGVRKEFFQIRIGGIDVRRYESGSKSIAHPTRLHGAG